MQSYMSAMQSYMNDENIKRYQKLIAISEGDPCRNDARHQTLLRLLADEKAKEKPKDRAPAAGPRKSRGKGPNSCASARTSAGPTSSVPTSRQF
jgi:hypothetical protein